MGRVLSRVVLRSYRFVVRARNKAFSLGVSRAFASFGKATVLELPVRVAGEERIRIGSGVFIGAGGWLQAIGPGKGVAIEIGDGTSMAGGCVVSAVESVVFGRSVLVARNVYVSDHIHAYEDARLPVLAQGVAKVAPVEIGDGVWLGENVVVCPGVRIGRGAVVGANAVVLDDVPDHSVAVGAPARVVREFAREAVAVA